MDKRIRVAMVVANMELMGICSVVMNYCRNIDLDRFEITIISGQEVNLAVEEELKSLNIGIRKVCSKKTHKLKYYAEMYRSVKKNEFDVVHVHGNSAIMALDLLVAKLKKIKVRIAHSHNSVGDHIKVHNILYPLFCRLYTKALACSDIAGRWAFRDKEFCVLPNGFDIERFTFDSSLRESIRRELNCSKEDILIGHTGRLNNQKNQLFLLEIFNEVLKVDKKYKLILVGAGELEEDIRSKIQELKISENVILYGETNEVYRLYSAMDLFIFPSKFEGLGISILEAQVNGLPCIASTNVPEAADITDEVVFLDLEKRAQWLEEILKKRERYEIDIKAKRINYYNIKNNVELLEDIYLGKN